MSDEKAMPAAPALGISLTVQLDQARNIVFQTFVPQEADKADINALVDKISAVADRQAAKYRLKTLKADLVKHEGTLSQLKEDSARLANEDQGKWKDGGRRGAYKPSPQVETAQRNAKVQETRFGEAIESLKAQIAEAEAEYAG